MSIQNIDCATLAEWQKSNISFIIDVREADEFAAGHIDGAYHLPLSQIQTEPLPEVPTQQKIVVHCAAGMRSQQACLYWQNARPERDFYNVMAPFPHFSAVGLPIIC